MVLCIVISFWVIIELEKGIIEAKKRAEETQSMTVYMYEVEGIKLMRVLQFIALIAIGLSYIAMD